MNNNINLQTKLFKERIDIAYKQAIGVIIKNIYDSNQALSNYSDCGKLLCELRGLFFEEKKNKTKRSTVCFTNYVRNNFTFSLCDAYKYIYLHNHWQDVLELNLFSTTKKTKDFSLRQTVNILKFHERFAATVPPVAKYIYSGEELFELMKRTKFRRKIERAYRKKFSHVII